MDQFKPLSEKGFPFIYSWQWPFEIDIYSPTHTARWPHNTLEQSFQPILKWVGNLPDRFGLP